MRADFITPEFDVHYIKVYMWGEKNERYKVCVELVQLDFSNTVNLTFKGSLNTNFHSKFKD